MTSGPAKKGRSRKPRRPKSVDTSPPTFETPAPAIETPPSVEACTAIGPALDPDKVHQVYLWLVAGGTDYDILQAIRTMWPEEKEAPLIAAAIAQLAQAGEMTPDVGVIVRGWCFEASRQLYRKMLEIGDFEGALRAVKQIAGMVGKD